MARILFADDDIEQLRLFRMLLESAGHAVVVADDPAERLRQLAQSGPHLLVMDLRFPDTRVGLALIRRIREQGCKTPVIILSGWPEELYGQPEEAMVERILVKPIAVGDLLQVIAALV